LPAFPRGINTLLSVLPQSSRFVTLLIAYTVDIRLHPSNLLLVCLSPA
jgi:hypothetical protein